MSESLNRNSIHETIGSMSRRQSNGTKRIFIDIETGGLSPCTHPVIQIGASVLDGGLQEIDTFEVKLKFNEAEASPEALKKSSYDRALWKRHGVTGLTAHERLSYFLREHATTSMISKKTGREYLVAQLFAHNAAFDSGFLWAWHKRVSKEQNGRGLFLPARRLMICTLQEALSFFDKKPLGKQPRDFKLSTLCEYFGVPFNSNEAHDALYDARKLAELYRVTHGINPQAGNFWSLMRRATNLGWMRCN